MTDRPALLPRHAFSLGLFGLAAAFGGLVLAWPFLFPTLRGGGDTAWVTVSLLALCLLGTFVDAGEGALTPRVIALLAVLVALNSILRFAENALPGPGEFSPVFALIILAGYAFGARFGFLTGALTLLVSAIITAGVGPWLPYQMFTAGWVGLSAGWLPGRAAAQPGRRAVIGLMAFGVVWGFLYGAIMNLSFWHLYAGTGAWAPGHGPLDTLQRYATFYALTSALPDAFRALGNAALIGLFGAPTLAALWRTRRSLSFTHTTA